MLVVRGCMCVCVTASPSLHWVAPGERVSRTPGSRLAGLCHRMNPAISARPAAPLGWAALGGLQRSGIASARRCPGLVLNVTLVPLFNGQLSCKRKVNVTTK